MAFPQSAELLGVGVAAFFASILWAESAAVRALLVAAAGVTALDFLAPLWRVPLRWHKGKERPSGEQCPSFLLAACRTAASCASSALRTLNAACDYILQKAGACMWFQVLMLS
mmetsp:Transcript_94825/g.164039  ORF Transcript_94825/g.164039 Transcript_94825/m.164039 type:complete len:113 (+) Transcript_94825:2-340(+)